MGRILNGVDLTDARTHVWDSTTLTWVKAVQAGGGAAGSTQVSISGVVDSSGATVNVADSANNAIKVNVVAGAAGGSTAITISRVQDSSNAGLAVGDSVNNAIRVNVVAGAAGGSTIVTISTGSVAINGNSTVIQGTSPWITGGNSTVVQGTSPWIIGGNSTVFQGGSPWTVTFPATLLSTAGQPSNSTGLIVRPIWSSTGADQPVRPVFSSTGADNPVVVASGNSSVTITAIAAGAGRINIGSTAADNLVRPVFSSTGADNPVVITAGNSSVTIASIAAGAGRINIGSTAADNVVRALLSSTQADNLLTVYQSTAAALLATVTIGTNLQSTTAPSSGSSGLVVRQVIDGLTTFASTSALASTSLSCASSVANVRFYVTAFTVTSTTQTPAHWGFFSSNGTLLWPMTIAALSSAVSGLNLAVGAPSYLFRTAVNEALNFKTAGSTVSGVQLGVSYFTAP